MDVKFPLPYDLSARFDSGMMMPITPANVVRVLRPSRR